MGETAGGAVCSMTRFLPTDLALLRRLRETNDEHVREELFLRHLPLARQLAEHYRTPEETLEDLVQIAAVGVVRALDDFDRRRGVDFASYAFAAVLCELAEHGGRSWRVPSQPDVHRVAKVVQRCTDELGDSAGHVPSVPDVAGAVERQFWAARAAPGARWRRESPRASPAEPAREDDALGAVEDAAMLESLMQVLGQREREVLRMRFADDLTQREIAERIGVSQMQVSRLIQQSVARLQRAAPRRD
jgi:RNA polymerase sigma-B factor